MIEPNHAELSIRRQCQLVGLSRSSWYAEPSEGASETPENLALMRLLDEEYTRHPFYGSRKRTLWLNEQGYSVNRKRVQRLMRMLGIQGIAPGPTTSKAHPEHEIYPYLLRGLLIDRPDQVWCTDITYVRLQRGFVYLVAIMDWFSRYVLSWLLSTTMDAEFCVETLEDALTVAKPEIFNSDQGSQFTSHAFTGVLKAHQVQISMDGQGRVWDNIFIERLWRSVKYENVYLNHYDTVDQARQGLGDYFQFYNHQRFHQALKGQTPAQVYQAAAVV